MKLPEQTLNFQELKDQIRIWTKDLGLSDMGVSDINLEEAEGHLGDWLKQGFAGEMNYMSAHGAKRSRPDLLIPGTIKVISVRLNYLPPDSQFHEALNDPSRAFISRYALGRDYHKVLRGKLKKLARKIESQIGDFGYRAFVDSAPVLEKALAEKAGLGWIGKHSNLIHETQGSWFFLGEIYTDLDLPVDQESQNHCGSCQACLDICPTQAIIEPYRVDARRCISYLTIELKEAIPEEFRRPMGNRIYGCDDCQLICPWSKFTQKSTEKDFSPRHKLGEAELLDLFSWTEEEFLGKTEGTAIRRIGYQSWQRNIAVALGNAPYDEKVIESLRQRAPNASDMVNEHIQWALAEQLGKRQSFEYSLSDKLLTAANKIESQLSSGKDQN